MFLAGPFVVVDILRGAQRFFLYFVVLDCSDFLINNREKIEYSLNRGLGCVQN